MYNVYAVPVDTYSEDINYGYGLNILRHKVNDFSLLKHYNTQQIKTARKHYIIIYTYSGLKNTFSKGFITYQRNV